MLDLKCHIPAGPRVAGAAEPLHTGPKARAAGPWEAHVQERPRGPLPEELGNGSGKWVPAGDHMIYYDPSQTTRFARTATGCHLSEFTFDVNCFSFRDFEQPRVARKKRGQLF